MNDSLKSYLLAGICFVVGLSIGLVIPINNSTNREPLSEGSQELSKSEIDGEAYIEKLEQEAQEALDNVYSGDTIIYQPNPEIINGMKEGVEINEMLCKTRGINCEAAKLFRKQYEDKLVQP